jgi:hypothetical protein
MLQVVGLLVGIAASQMDPALVSAITRPEQTGDSDYRRASEPLLKLRRLVPEIYYAYVFITTPEGLRFTIDSTYYIQNQNASASAVSVGDLYVDPSPDALEAARTGAITISSRPYTDDFGSFMSGFAPIRDSEGDLVGFVGIDFSLAQLQRKELPLQLTYLLGSRSYPFPSWPSPPTPPMPTPASGWPSAGSWLGPSAARSRWRAARGRAAWSASACRLKQSPQLPPDGGAPSRPGIPCASCWWTTVR